MTASPSAVALPNRVATVLFDLDGTLTDPAEGIRTAIHRAMAELGRPLDPRTDLDWCIGPPLRGIFAELLGDDAPIDEAIARYRAWYGEVGLFRNTVYAGVPELLAGLRTRGVRVVLATSKLRDYAARILDRFGLAAFFDAVHGAEWDGTRAVKTELLPWILEHERIDPRGAVMVGDREHDVFGARAAAVAPIGAAWGYGTRRELAAAGAVAIADDPAALVRLLAARIG
jgi:phosphoglycolate phosphatase